LRWTVGANGDVYLLHRVTRPSTTSPGTTVDWVAMTTLPHGSLTWSADLDLVGYAGGQLALGAAPDGSLHFAYSGYSSDYYMRSRDGVTWEKSPFRDHLSSATLVDPVLGNPSYPPHTVGGLIEGLAAQDYDHAEIYTAFYGSMDPSGTYLLRRCPPFEGPNQIDWPAERFDSWGTAFVATDERGLTSVMTPIGLHVEEVGP
jgi:hypothetical protein